MKVTVDRVGRIVIPKRLRDALGIGPGTRLEVIADGGGLRLGPAPHAERPIEESGLPILGSVDGAVLTDEDVRNLRDPRPGRLTNPVAGPAQWLGRVQAVSRPSTWLRRPKASHEPMHMLSSTTSAWL